MESLGDLGFPGTPYPAQTAFVTFAKKGIASGGLVVLESPTGTGKSLSLLCSALSWLRSSRTQAVLERLHTEEVLQDQDAPQWVRDKVFETRMDEADTIISGWDNFRKQLQAKLSQAGILTSEGQPIMRGVKRNSPQFGGTVKIGGTEDLFWDPTEQNGALPVDSEFSPSKTRRVQVIICSRTHSQLSQLIKELRRIQGHSDFNCVTVGSREHLCVHPSVRNSKTGDASDLCRKLVEEENCTFRKFSDNMVPSLLLNPMDIEDMRACASTNASPGCPYYASRTAVGDADIIFAPYSSVLQPATRMALGIEIADNVLIIDEAHNILDAVNSVRSVTLSEAELNSLSSALSNYVEAYSQRLAPRNSVRIIQLRFVARQLSRFLTESSETALNVMEFVSQSKCGRADLLEMCRMINDGQFSRKLRGFAEYQMSSNPSAIYSFGSFLNAILNARDSDRVIIKTATSRTLHFIALDAEVELAKVITLARAVLLVGGTMQPLDDFRGVSTLAGRPFSSFSASHSICPTRVLARVITHSRHGDKLLFTRENRLDITHKCVVQEVVGSALESFNRGGIVVFVSSYDYALTVRGLVETLCANHKVGLLTDTRCDKADSIMKRFSACIQKSGRGVLISVINGSLSEGIDFKDDLCRCLILIGLPYANLTDVALQERLKYYDHMHEKRLDFPPGRSWYETRCMKAINQTLGRAIRHVRDWAAVLLVDSRFDSTGIRRDLSGWVNETLNVAEKWEELEDDLQTFSRRWTQVNS